MYDKKITNGGAFLSPGINGFFLITSIKMLHLVTGPSFAERLRFF